MHTYKSIFQFENCLFTQVIFDIKNVDDLMWVQKTKLGIFMHFLASESKPVEFVVQQKIAKVAFLYIVIAKKQNVHSFEQKLKV